MNFQGFMVTDYSEINNLFSWHNIANSTKNAIYTAISDTTIDMSMVPTDTYFYDYLLELYYENKINISRIDESVYNILTIKNKLGLLDNPIPPIKDDDIISQVGQDSDIELSLNASREVITLLKNEQNILPLETSRNILITGDIYF